MTRQIGFGAVAAISLWTGTSAAQTPLPEWAVEPEVPHVLAAPAPLEWQAEAAEHFDDEELAVEELAEEEEAAGVAEPVVRLAPEVHVYAEVPVTLYAARVRGIARGLARRGVAVPERLRPETPRICRAPCVARLSRGHYVIAAALDGEDAIPVPEAVRVGGPTDLEIEYVSRSTARNVGLGLVIGGIVLGTASALLGPVIGGGNESTGRYIFWGGMTGGLAMCSLGAWLSFQGDYVEAAAAPAVRDDAN